MEEKNSSFFSETIRFAFITLLIVLPIRFFIAEPFIVSGSSMEPTFKTGEYLVVDRLSYDVREPIRGEVIIFRYPNDQTKYFIKRIIGLPGETVILHGDALTIINKDNPQGLSIDQSYIPKDNKDDELTVTLKDDEYFVMGDNRKASSDSRVWGPLPKSLIIGRAFLRLLPITTIGVLPGNHQTK